MSSSMTDQRSTSVVFRVAFFEASGGVFSEAIDSVRVTSGAATPGPVPK